MEIEKRAREHFRGKGRLNCAQAVLKVFQSHSGMTDDEIAEFSDAGGGRAPDGHCGALYAAQILLDDDVLFGKLKDEFQLDADGFTCKTIRAAKKLSCADCVVLASKFLEEHRSSW